MKMGQINLIVVCFIRCLDKIVKIRSRLSALFVFFVVV